MPKPAAKKKSKPETTEATAGISAANVPVKRKESPPKSEGGRSPFMLRFDNEVYIAIKELAEKAGVSANQLMEGLSRWAVKNARVGVPIVNDSGEVIGEEPERGCVWAGEMQTPDDEKRQLRSVWMFLDFTNRRVVREDV